ncbi:hypothetical protein LCGC14_0390760 [marine sediment metagenome]|uniref:Uncharacterized protein n=1 Tax=marine sediment metagenome TaxID=412755 RepID=A0A0F9VLU6_9ZZZZ
MKEQKTLFDTAGAPETVDCPRCGQRCRVDLLPGSKAKMLRRSKKGLCANCAVHDWLRNTYPPNIILAQSGPKVLLFEHIQTQFAEIMKMGFADAKPDEIDWQKIVDNWELPFKNKVKATGMNPASQDVLDMEPEMQAHEENYFREEMIAKEEGFGSLREKRQAERDRIIKEEFLPLL